MASTRPRRVSRAHRQSWRCCAGLDISLRELRYPQWRLRHLCERPGHHRRYVPVESLPPDLDRKVGLPEDARLSLRDAGIPERAHGTEKRAQPSPYGRERPSVRPRVLLTFHPNSLAVSRDEEALDNLRPDHSLDR